MSTATTPLRIGFGHDIHALVPDRELWLGGVRLPFELGLKGHSDADALLHAVMDALLGAAALGDIGMLFPDTDPAYRGISSMSLLGRVMERISAAGFRVVNIDTMIHCERPKIAPHRDAIRDALAAGLKIDRARVSVKAGTNEGFDAVGERRAIACRAVVLLESTEEG
ncbi:MAG TPA: 2-C-methyl-D-erythritol 2,4-cyclodiphosphate synthase [Candidatus Ozemobacteraceae bacterium]|nr:2-C-methyl-D-erythritol 2,4-cyclodiphosphate synthase [Candidatus Ozemobacteraceae bacterium]